MTSPYSPSTATDIAEGATEQGYAETTTYTTWDGSAMARHNIRELMTQMGIEALYNRDNTALLRKQLVSVPSTTQVKIMTCGDSITAGFGSGDGKGYNAWLADLINRQNIKAVMSTCSHNGWYLADLKANIAASLAANTPDIVTINIGTNDYDFNAAYTVATYGALVDQILASSPNVKVVCAALAISQQANIAAHERSANQIIQQVVSARSGGGRVVLADLTNTTMARWASDQAQPLWGRWTIDGIHPNDFGYLQMAMALYAALYQWITGAQPL